MLLFLVARGAARNFILVLCSAVFYFWISPEGALIIILSMAFDYYCTRLMLSGSPARKKIFLVLLVVFNLAVLFYFKYLNFFIDQCNGVLSLLGLSALPWKNIIFPAGISFITFHRISYIVDCYRGHAAPVTSVAAYASYILMFPKLLQGPIVRYQDIADRLSARRATAADFTEGLFRFCIGLGKKVLVADLLGDTANAVFALPYHSLTTGFAWLGIVCYTFQLYFDFAGYSDMAIGIARMLGFSFPENFNWPYLSRNFTEFWRRWHITLSGWFREYVYIPLGGNRVSAARNYLNLWIVFFLSGLWHGANWTFIVWGLYHGFFLFLDKVFWLKRSRDLPAFITMPVTFLLVMVGWVFFRSDSIQAAAMFLARMFDVTMIHDVNATVLAAELIKNRGIAALAAVAAIHLLYPGILVKIAGRIRGALPPVLHMAGMMIISLAIFLLSFISIVNNKFMPFIYFRF